MPNNFTTLQSWDSLDLHTLKKAGADEYHGPCPVTGEGKDCFWVKPDARLIGCRGCAVNGLSGPQFTEHLSAIGGASGESVSLQTYDWTNYLTGNTVTQTRHVGDPKYRWPKDTKTGGLVYLGERYDRDATRPIIWTEGAKAATFAAAKLPTDEYDVIGFVSASTVPNSKTITALTKGRSCIVWPDDDTPGRDVAARLVSALARSAADVVTINPALLGLKGGHGHDAAEWHPGGSPVEELRAACGTAQPAPVEHFRSIWTYAAEATPAVLIPGLAWRGRVSKISSAPKLGKTSLLTNGIAAWQADGSSWAKRPDPPEACCMSLKPPGPASLVARTLWVSA